MKYKNLNSRRNDRLWRTLTHQTWCREYWDRRNWHNWHIGGSLLHQGHGRRRVPLVVCAYFPFHRSSVSSVFDDLSFLQWCCTDLKIDLLFCITQHTHLTRPSSFRERNTGTLNCDIPKWTSKKFEFATKVLSLILSWIQSYILSFHMILHSLFFTRS